MLVYKRLILLLLVLISSCLILLKNSTELIGAFWLKPSLFSGKRVESWPRNMAFQIPNPVIQKSKVEKHYFFTDQHGALRGKKGSAKPLAWIFGDGRTANLTIPGDLRWTSLINLPNLNFGIPRFNFFELKEQISKLIAEISDKPRFVFLGDGIGKWVFLGADLKKDSWPSYELQDLSPYWVWGRPATFHTLFEFLCFYWTSPVCEFQHLPRESAATQKKTEAKWRGKDIKNRFNLAFEKVSEVESFLRKMDIVLIGLTIPYAKWEPKWKRDQNTMLKLKYGEFSIPVVDIEKCFDELGNPDRLFNERGMEVGSLTEEGNEFFAECFDRLMVKI